MGVTVSYNPDILSCLANLSNDEVFTPPELVNRILDMLPSELWSNPDTRVLDPCSKSGVFLREIAKRMIEGEKNAIPDLQERIDHIFHKQLYGIAITELTSLLSRRSLYCSKMANGQYSVSQFKTPGGNIIYRKLQHTWNGQEESAKCIYCGASKEKYERLEDLESYAYEFIHLTDNEIKELSDMHFDLIIGNPPYQLSDGGNGVSATPLYHKFVLQAKKLKPHYLTMIIPARWYAGGKGLDTFREEMLNDDRISALVDFESSKECFAGVDIAGGVCYFLWNRDYSGPCLIKNTSDGTCEKRYLNEFPIFIRSNKALSIIHKVLSNMKQSMSMNMLPRNPFGFGTTERGSNKKDPNDIVLVSSKGKGFVSRKAVIKNSEYIDWYKIGIGRLVPSNGELDVKPGEKYKVITNTTWILPGEVNTETYLIIGKFRTKNEALNFDAYIHLKFPRFLLRQAISSVNVTRDCFRFVPEEDFSKSWTDEELYKKYGLTDDEIAFIESLIQPMNLSDKEA